MIKFRLSKEVRTMLDKKNLPKPDKERSAHYSSPKIYAARPDLMSGGFLHATDRVMTKEKMDKKFNDAFKLSLKDKCIILYKRVKNLIKGSK